MMPNETNAVCSLLIVPMRSAASLSGFSGGIAGSPRYGSVDRSAGTRCADWPKYMQGRRYRTAKTSVRPACRPRNGEVMQTRSAWIRAAATAAGGLMLAGVGSAAMADYPEDESSSQVDVNVDISGEEPQGALSMTVA